MRGCQLLAVRGCPLWPDDVVVHGNLASQIDQYCVALENIYSQVDNRSNRFHVCMYPRLYDACSITFIETTSDDVLASITSTELRKRRLGKQVSLFIILLQIHYSIRNN